MRSVIVYRGKGELGIEKRRKNEFIGVTKKENFLLRWKKGKYKIQNCKGVKADAEKKVFSVLSYFCIYIFFSVLFSFSNIFLMFIATL